MDVTTIEYSRGTTRISAPELPRDVTSRPASNKNDTHENTGTSYGVVYVNNVARQALLEQLKPRFPVGSVIVREKLPQENAVTPELIVVMVKRERGFNKKANDWEFLMIDASLNKITHRETNGGCRDCHKQQKSSDFVFRTYLPDDVRNNQR